MMIPSYNKARNLKIKMLKESQSIKSLTRTKNGQKAANLSRKSDPRQVVQCFAQTTRQMPTKNLQKEEPTLSIEPCTTEQNSIDYPAPTVHNVKEILHYSQHQVETFGVATQGGQASQNESHEMLKSNRQHLLHSPFFQDKSLNSHSSGASKVANDFGGTNTTQKNIDQELPLLRTSRIDTKRAPLLMGRT